MRECINRLDTVTWRTMEAMTTNRLFLASGSPRRRAFLTDLGLAFRVQSADIDETPLAGELPAPLAIRLAQGKARAVADRLRAAGEDGLVLAADTVVALDDQLLGKPVDAAEARRMLAAMRGRTHQVVTAVCVLEIGSGQEETRSSIADVKMRIYTNDEIERYINSGDPFDKAGGYAIQNTEFAPVEGWAGSYTAIMGLPLEDVAPMLAHFGVEIAPQRLDQALRDAEGKGGR
jgi:septum formation protein